MDTFFSAYDQLLSSNLCLNGLLACTLDTDRCEGEGIAAEAWFRQGKEGQKLWGDDTGGRWIQIAFHIDMH